MEQIDIDNKEQNKQEVLGSIEYLLKDASEVQKELIILGNGWVEEKTLFRTNDELQISDTKKTYKIFGKTIKSEREITVAVTDGRKSETEFLMFTSFVFNPSDDEITVNQFFGQGYENPRDIARDYFYYGIDQRYSAEQWSNLADILEDAKTFA